VLKLMVELSGRVEYREAARILSQVGQIEASDSSTWRQAQRWGEAFKAQADQERIRATVLPGRWGTPCRDVRPKGRMGVAMDGTMMRIRGEGWKEVKVGCVFDVRMKRVTDPETGERVEQAHAVNNSYVGYLGGPKRLGQMMWAEASRRGWERAVDTQVLGDGAPWIWNQVGEHFYDSRQGVDWCHAVEHLADVACLLKGEGTLAATRWLNACKTRLFEGHAALIGKLVLKAAAKHPPLAKELRKEGHYFLTHQYRMQYQELREEGWAIGSGMVESAAKQFKARFTGSGMRWSRSGAERLIPVRCAIMGDRFDDLWQTVYNSPQN
jgi:hypothetical protein